MTSLSDENKNRNIDMDAHGVHTKFIYLNHPLLYFIRLIICVLFSLNYLLIYSFICRGD